MCDLEYFVFLQKQTKTCPRCGAQFKDRRDSMVVCQSCCDELQYEMELESQEQFQRYYDESKT